MTPKKEEEVNLKDTICYRFASKYRENLHVSLLFTVLFVVIITTIGLNVYNVVHNGLDWTNLLFIYGLYIACKFLDLIMALVLISSCTCFQKYKDLDDDDKNIEFTIVYLFTTISFDQIVGTVLFSIYESDISDDDENFLAFILLIAALGLSNFITYPFFQLFAILYFECVKTPFLAVKNLIVSRRFKKSGTNKTIDI